MRKYDVPSARDLGGLPNTAYVAVRTAKEAFTTWLLCDSPPCNTRQYLSLPEFLENKISVACATYKVYKTVPLSINTSTFILSLLVISRNVTF